MFITVELPDNVEAQLILRMLQAVPQATVQVLDTAPTLPHQHIANYFGIVEPRLSMAEIDKRLNEQKEEWL